MKTIFKAIALASAPAAMLAVAAAPAHAQSKQGVAVVDQQEALSKTTAFTTAIAQMQVTYKANLDSISARQTALQAELKTKADTFQAALKAAGGKPTPALETQYNALQKRKSEAEQELQTLSAPVARARNYAEAQIAAKMNDALKAAMVKKNVDLVLVPDATVSYGPGVDITSAVTAELNALVPSVGIVPPAGWQPGQPLPGAAATPATAPGR
jgi:Skp family chaperone for outer membrane proteins